MRLDLHATHHPAPGDQHHGHTRGRDHSHSHHHPPNPPTLLFIENVGNLVCPAMWDPGESAKVAILSVTEVSGTLGEHGLAMMSLRESLTFDTAIESDTAALHALVQAMLQALPTTLNEIAQQSGVGTVIEEAAIPILPQVAAACELLGLDPLHVANEGKLIALCTPEVAVTLLAAMRAHPLGLDAQQIGTVIQDGHCFVQMNTRFGGCRVVDWLSGEQLPRICQFS